MDLEYLAQFVDEAGHSYCIRNERPGNGPINVIIMGESPENERNMLLQGGLIHIVGPKLVLHQRCETDRTTRALITLSETELSGCELPGSCLDKLTAEIQGVLPEASNELVRTLLLPVRERYMGTRIRCAYQQQKKAGKLPVVAIVNTLHVREQSELLAELDGPHDRSRSVGYVLIKQRVPPAQIPQ